MNSIFHIDMDAFFTSVETSRNKNLENKPVAVGGNKKGSVISSANYLARSYGVKAAMPAIIAKKICPTLNIIDVNQSRMQIYNNISNLIYDLLKKEVSPVIEIGSIDEWYIDISDTKLASLPSEEINYLIKEKIKNRFGLNCTIGCSYNKIFAKIATNLSKPNGFLIIDKTNYKNIVWKMNIEKMPYIGKSSFPILHSKNIYNISDLINHNDDSEMVKLLGNKWIEYKRNSCGDGNKNIITTNHPKSIGRSKSFYSSKVHEEILLELNDMIHVINNSILYKNIKYRSINISLKMVNGSTISKSKSYEEYVSEIKLSEIKKMLNVLTSSITINEIKVCSLNISKLKESFLIDSQDNIFSSNVDDQSKKIDSNEIIKKLNKKFDKKIFYLGVEKKL